MKQIVLILVALLLCSLIDATPVEQVNVTLTTFECQPEYIGYCFFRDLVTTKENPRFQPYHPNPNSVSDIFVSGGQLEVLTSDICNYFHNLERLYIYYGMGVEIITEEAFYNCPILKSVKIEKSKLTRLPETLFVNNPELNALKINDNPITQLPRNIFSNNPEVHVIELINTPLEEIPFDQMIGHNYSTYIDVYSNNLKDFPIEFLLETFPNLSRVAFNDNNIKCSRVQEILDALSRRPRVNIWNYSSKKPREEEVGEVGGIICIP